MSENQDALPIEEPLSDQDWEILALERVWWQYAGAKEKAIRDKFDLSATAFYQQLNRIIDTREALERDPLTVKRLQRMRRERQRSRSRAMYGIIDQ